MQKIIPPPHSLREITYTQSVRPACGTRSVEQWRKTECDRRSSPVFPRQAQSGGRNNSVSSPNPQHPLNLFRSPEIQYPRRLVCKYFCGRVGGGPSLCPARPAQKNYY